MVLEWVPELDPGDWFPQLVLEWVPELVLEWVPELVLERVLEVDS